MKNVSVASEKASAGTTPSMEHMSTPELLKAYKQTGDTAYKWALVLRYDGLIKNAALQMRGIYSSFAQVDDIVSEGVLTLQRAIDNFDEDKGVKFETYVSKRIRGMVIDLARIGFHGMCEGNPNRSTRPYQNCTLPWGDFPPTRKWRTGLEYL